MGDSWMTAWAMCIAVVIMGIFPLMVLGKQKDETANLAAQTAVTKTVNEARSKGILTYDDYENLHSTLVATGNSYDISIEAKIADGNLEKKEGTSSDKIYYTIYHTQIMEQLSTNGKIKFNEEDNISIVVYRTNTTIFEQLSNYFFRKAGNGTGEKVAEASGMVTTTGN